MSEQEAPPPSSISIGLVIDGKYRLIGLRGEGAMGSVWHAEHVPLGYAVAIKFLHKAIANLRDSRGRFEREAQIAARLGEASRHVARVLDYGVLETGMPYLVMELLDGEGLDAALRREGRLPLVEVSRIVTQLSRALEVAHAQGVVHRDLKPANIFLCHEDGDDPSVKLLDFGVAKATLENVSFATTTAGAVIGTPSYMAPEQVEMGTGVDARTDLWALAVVTYRLATGQMPFGKGTLTEIALRIVTVDPPAPTTRTRELPPAFDSWMRQGLAKKQSDRFQTARAMASSLAEIARAGVPRREDAHGISSAPAATKKEGAAATAATISNATLLSAESQPARQPLASTLHSSTDSVLVAKGGSLRAPAMAEPPRAKRSRVVLIAIIAASLISGCLMMFLWLRSHESEPTPPRSGSLSQPTPPTLPSAATIESASASEVVPVDSVASSASSSPSASTQRPVSTHLRVHGRPPHAGASTNDDWGSRNQM